MNSKLIVFLLGLFLCYLPEVSSQSSNLIKIGNDSGFKSINVRKILKDKYGFIWIGTQDGLYRYDAHEFEVFKNNFDNNSLGNNFIIDIVYDGNNYLYVSTYEGGLDRVNVSDMHIENLINRDKAEAWKIFSTLGKLSLAGNSLLVYNIYGLFAYNIKQGSFSVLSTENTGIGNNLVENIYFLDSLYIAVAYNNSSVYVGKLVESANSIQLKKEAVINNVSVKGIKTIDGHNYLLTNKNLFKLNSSFVPEPLAVLQAGFEKNDVADFTVTKKFIYIATSAGVLQTQMNLAFGPDNTLMPIPDTENELINCLYADDQQILWIGTYNGLSYSKLNKQKFVTFPGTQNLKNPHLYTLLKDGDCMYACATNNLYKVNLLTKEYTIVNGSSSLGLVHHIINDDKINKIVSTNKGMALLNTVTDELSVSKFNVRFPEWKSFTNSYFNNSIEIKDRIYWASENNNGLVMWDRKEKKVRQILTNELDSSDFQIHNLKTDKEGNLWLLCNTAVYKVNTLQEKIISKISFSTRKETFNTPIFFDFYDDGKNYWFATYGGGLNKYNYKSGKWEFITEKNGLSNNCVYSILPDNSGNLWVSTNSGISMINPAGKVTSYTIEDGLQHNVFEEKSYFKDNDTLYLGGLNGFTKIIPGIINEDTKIPEAVIRKIEFQTNNETRFSNKLGLNINRFPTGTKSLRITVAIPDYLFRKKYQLSFKINNSEEYLKLENNAIIALNNLTGKSYKISLKIIDPNNNESIIDNFYTFSIRPKWHETSLFKIFSIALIAGILYSLYRFRVNQLKKVIAVRKKIASDLHDDLGGTLNSIRVYSHLVTSENKEEHIVNIKKNTKEAVAGLKDLIWTLDDQKNTVQALAEKITAFAMPALAANNTDFKMVCPYDCRSLELGKEEKRNLYLIFKEAVTNTIKYAGASSVQVNIERTNDKLRMIYTDNGKGLPENVELSGNGLRNIKERATVSGYSASFGNNENDPGIKLVVEKNKERGLLQRLHSYFFKN